MPPVTRTAKFAVYFKGLDRKALEGKEGLWYQLVRTQGEVTRAANQVLSALYLVRTGMLPHPKREDGSLVPLKTLAWAPFRQKAPWVPFGDPVYLPGGAALAAGNLTEMSGLIYTRLEEDFKDIRKGEQTLPTFRTLPVPIRADSVRVTKDGEDFLLSLSLWAGRGQARVNVAPVLGRRERGQHAILEKIVSGTYKHGSAKLYRDDRSKKWMISLSWTGNAAEVEGDLFAGVDLGLATTATVAYVSASGKAAFARDRFDIPDTVTRAYKRVESERRARLRLGRLVHGARSGHGVDRKLRPVEHLAHKRDNLVTDAVRNIASAIVQTAIKRGAGTLVLEDLGWSTEKMMEDTQGLSNRDRARARKNFLSWQQGALRQTIREVAQREGLTCVEVDAKHTSNTCFSCGKVYERPPKGKDDKYRPYCSGLGRISQDKFKCSCGWEEHADYNAGLNIASRARSS